MIPILSEGYRASQETVPKHGTLRAAAQKSTTHTKRLDFHFVRGTPSTSRDCARARNATLFPEPEDRNGRHWMRVELGTILMKFAFKISSVQLWSRRDSSGALL